MIKNILSYGFVEGFSKGLNKLILVLLPIFLITSDYGKIGVIIAIELLLPVILTLGFERVVLRFYGGEKKINDFFSTILVSLFGMHLILFLAIIFYYIVVGNTLLGLQIFPDWILLIGLTFVRSIFTIKMNIIRVKGNHTYYFVLRLFSQIFKLILIFLLIFMNLEYVSYLIGSFLSLVITLIGFQYYRKETISFRFNKITFNKFIVFSWPFIFHGIAGSVLGNVDKLIINHYLNLTETGLYTFYYAIGSALAFVYVGLSVYIEPLIYKQKTEKERDVILSKYLRIALLLGTLTLFFMLIARDFLLPIFYEENLLVHSNYIIYIAVGHLFLPFYLVANYQLIYDEKTSKIALFSVIISLVNLGLNLFLIPLLGLIAAVYTTVISYFIMSTIFTFVTIDVTNKKQLEKLFLLLFFIIVTVFLFLEFIPDYIVVLVTLICLLVYSKKEFKHLFK